MTTMPIALSDEHRALDEVARAMAADRAGTAGARRALLDPPTEPRWWELDALWKEIVATGWLGLHIEERFGGQGYGLLELTIVLEQLGRFALSGPFLPTVAVSAVIAEAGTDEQRQRWLPKLSSGDMVAALGTTTDVTQTDSRVSAHEFGALGEPSSDVFLLPIGDDVVLVRAGAGVTARRSESADRLMAAVTVVGLAEAAVADVFPGAAATTARILRLLASAEAVGGLEACTEMATKYAGTREQFGRPIGSFQAVKHHCANMLVDTELAVAVTWDAARACDKGEEGEQATLAATMAAEYVLAAYQRVALKNIQVHGGIAYTWEHDAHLYVRRATVLLSFVVGPDALCGIVAKLQLAGVRARRGLDLPPEAEQYRQAAREFRDELERTDPLDRHKLWARSGYLEPHWPKPYGRAAQPAEQLIIDEELRDVDRPSLGLSEWVLPTLLQHGNAEQIDRLVWPSIEGEIRWCQLFSEPGAGSDAAAVSTKATRVDGGWLITGQKVWTSDAMHCQRGLITVRTDPDARKHKGITAMIVELSAPGVEVRPLKELTGEALFNEVFLTEVFVPDRDVVGAVNSGWAVVMATFGNERVTIGSGSSTLTAGDLLPMLARYRADDDVAMHAVGELLVEEYAMSTLNLRQTARAVFATGPGIEGNIAKLFGAEHAQRVTALALRIAGEAALTGAEPVAVHDYLFARCLTIAGGTSEILRNLIAERILGLPREPAAN